MLDKIDLRSKIITALKDEKVLFYDKIKSIPESVWDSLDLEYGEIEPSNCPSKHELLKKITDLLSVNFARERFQIALEIHKELHNEYILTKQKEIKHKIKNQYTNIFYLSAIAIILIFGLIICSQLKSLEEDVAEFKSKATNTYTQLLRITKESNNKIEKNYQTISELKSVINKIEKENNILRKEIYRSNKR